MWKGFFVQECQDGNRQCNAELPFHGGSGQQQQQQAMMLIWKFIFAFGNNYILCKRKFKTCATRLCVNFAWFGTLHSKMASKMERRF